MTHERNIEIVLDAWFADGPAEVPDRVLDAVVDRIERQSQRPAWRVQDGERRLGPALRPLLAIAAVIVVAVVGFNLLPALSTGIGGATPTPSPSPSASPSPSPLSPSPSSTPASLADELWDELDPGVYVHDQSEPAVTLDIPANWWLTAEVPWGFGIRPEAYTVDEGFRVWYDMRATRNDPDCPEAADPSIGHRATDLIAEFTNRPGIVATDPQPISVGGLDGWSTDLSLDPDWSGTCPFDPALVGVTLFTDEDKYSGDGTPFWGIGGTERLRIIALDDTKDSNVMIVVSGADVDRFDALVAEAMPVVETFEFDVAP